MKKKSDTEDKASMQGISITLSPDTLSRVKAFIDNKENKCRNRSNLIEDALNYYLETIVCPNCGTHTLNSKFCSNCGCSLDLNRKDREIAEFLYLEQHPEHRDSESKIVVFHLSDSMVRRLLAGDMVEPAEDAVVIDRAVYRKNIEEYLKERKRR